MPKKLCSTGSLFFASTLFITSFQASALPLTIDAEDLGNQASMMAFYKGQTDFLGRRGINYGVPVGTNSPSLIDGDSGDSGNFSNEPTTDTVMFFLSGGSALNDNSNINTDLPFFYTLTLDLTVALWDVPKTTANLRGNITVDVNNTAKNCAFSPKGKAHGKSCNFEVDKLTFSGTAMQLDVSSTAMQVGFDNMTFGSINPSFSLTPLSSPSIAEPRTFAIFGLGLFAISLLLAQKRR